MDLGKTLSFTFDDPDWMKKILLGGVISLVPILNLAVYGYSLEVTRRVINHDPRPLPEWDNLGDKIIKGLLYAVIALVYALPIIVLACLFGGAVSVFGGTAASSSGNTSDAMGGVISLLSICFSCVAILYSLFVALLVPAAVGNYVAKDQLSAAFKFGEVFSLVRNNIGTYLMVLVISILASTVASLVGSIACGIGILFTMVWYITVLGHATGQAYLEASTKIGLV